MLLPPLPPSTDPFGRRRTLLQRAAWLCALLVLVVTGLSAFLRQSSAGLDCTPWPACHARAARAEAARAPPSAAEHSARAVHRAVASSLLLLLAAMAAFAWRRSLRLAAEGRVVLVALGLVLFLAVLGPFTANTRAPAVTLGNLLGGLLLFAACVRLAVPPGAMGEQQRQRLHLWSVVAGLVLLLQIGLGALVSAGYAGLSCPQLSSCRPGADGWAALKLWLPPGEGAGMPEYAAGMGVHLLHRLATLATLAALGMLALSAWQAKRRREAALLVALAALQVELGVTLVLAQLPLAAALAHNLLAALLLGTVAALAARSAPLSPRL